MSNQISLKKSSVADKIPLPGDLQFGELALNYTDGNLFYKNSSNTVTTIASNKFISVTGNVTGGNLITTGLISATGNITGGNILGSGAGLSGINAFGNIAVSGEATISADNTSDTLTFVEGSGISITTDSANNTITIESTSTASIFAAGGDMGTVDEAVTSSEDLGLVTDAATIDYNLGTETTSGIVNPSLLLLPSYTVSGLGSLSAAPAGQFVFCSDESGGAIPAFSDGTNWRRVSDRAVIT